MDSFSSRAQTGLEYLMTYGWAFVLIVTIGSVLFYLVSPNTSNAVFSSSNPMKLPVKTGNITAANDAKILLLNSTGGKIQVKGISPVGYYKCTVNGSGLPVDVISGGNIEFSCKAPANKKGAIRIEYKDSFGQGKTVTVSSNGGSVPVLAAYYNFNGNANDTSGNGNNCSLFGNAAISGNALSLDGLSASYANCGNGLTTNIQGSITISAWIDPNQYPTAGRSRIIDKGCFGAICGATPPGGYAFFLTDDPDWNPHTIAYVYLTGWVEDSAPNIINLNQWQHAAITFDALSGRLKQYVNGVLMTDEPFEGMCYNDMNGGPLPCGSALDSYDWPLVIGNRGSGLNSPFNGLIDELKIYNGALASDQICSVCNETIPTGGNCSC